MRVYVVRHGRTIWNEKHISQGWRQNRLSQFGKQQVQETAEKLKDFEFDMIFSSPLMRTMQTTNIINKFHNVKVFRDKRLIEDNKGIFTGRTKEQITEEEWKLFSKDPKACGLESLEEIYARVKDFTDYLKKNFLHKTPLVVTHDCVALMLEYCSKYDSFVKSNYETLVRFNNAEFRQFDL